jgi:hypothetical protein
VPASGLYPVAAGHDALISRSRLARVIGPGLAVLPPLPRMLFWPGYVTEQALVVNVRGLTGRRGLAGGSAGGRG